MRKANAHDQSSGGEIKLKSTEKWVATFSTGCCRNSMIKFVCVPLGKTKGVERIPETYSLVSITEFLKRNAHLSIR